MEPLTPDWLNYGSFGLLAALLFVAGLGLREYAKRAEARREDQDKRMWQLIEQDRKEREAHTTAWREMVEQDIDAKRANTSAIVAMCETMDRKWERHERDTERNQAALITAIRQERP